MKITLATHIGGVAQRHVIDTDVMRNHADGHRADLLEELARDVIAIRVPDTAVVNMMQNITTRLHVTIEEGGRLLVNQIYYRPVPLAAARLAIGVAMVYQVAERNGTVDSLGA